MASPARRDREGKAIRLGLSTRVNLLIYTLIAAMLLVYVPTVRFYWSLREAFAAARRELEQHQQVRRLEVLASRQTASRLDAVVVEAARDQAVEAAAALQDDIDELRQALGGAGAPAAGAIDRAYLRLRDAGIEALALADEGRRDPAIERLKEKVAPLREEELRGAVDAAFGGGGALGDTLLGDRLAAVSGRLLRIPFVDLEAGASRLRSHAAETLAAVTFLQHLQRLIAGYQDFVFLEGAWHKLYLARGKAEKAYERWQTQVATAPERDAAFPAERIEELVDGYRELNRLGGTLVDLSEDDAAAALDFYAVTFRPASASVAPVMDAVFATYRDHLDAGVRSVSRRIDAAGYLLAAFALVVVVLAFGSPWLMSRWIVQPIGTLTQATRKLGQGDLSEKVEIDSTDELGELASCFNQMVVDLSEAQDQLSRRERLVVLGQLAGSVAHEIRNPLGVMKNSIYFLRLTQKLKDEKAIQHLGLIEDEINKANRIITELLDYARDPTSQIGSFLLQDAFYKALAQVEVPESVSLEHHFEEEAMKVTGDSGQIERILANFLRNAVQAMPGGGTLCMSCRRDGEEVVAEVRDTGVGIAQEDIARIFEPLFTGKAKGIGLGLPLSQRYAQLNGGRIECESELGVGATFRLVLPASRSQESAIAVL